MTEKLDRKAFNAGVNTVLSFRGLRWNLVYMLLNLALFIAPNGASRDLLVEKLREMKLRILATIAYQWQDEESGNRK